MLNNHTTESIPVEQLVLDRQNPRLSEFGISENSKEEEIIKILWEEMSADELAYSIVANGFWDFEPLVVIKNGSQFIAIEGNRRLAAVKLIHNPGKIRIPEILRTKINSDLLERTKTLPCIVVESREEAWKFIGFKHVNGPAKWGSYAKATYISEIHNQYNVPISEIAYQIGDTNNTAQKLYQGFMVLNQAIDNKLYSLDEVQANRIFFSHLYTGLQREGIRSYLEIKDASEESSTPVPETKFKELKKLLEWLYGSKLNNIQPIIKSQNPDLKYLDEVLQSKEATVALNDGEPLSYAHELSREPEALFEDHILAAKRNLQKARAYLTTGYHGEESLLKAAGSVVNLANDLYEEMEKINLQLKPQVKRERKPE